MVVDTTYYDLLDISPDADDVEIKKAYKRKAMQHHPDKNPDNPLAHETFQKIGQAYETLSDPNNRATYDQYGLNGPSRPSPGGEFDMDDLFASMFGGGGPSFSFDPSGPGAGRKPTRGRNTDVRYEISLEEVYKGKKVVMMLERDRVCGGYKGSGGRHGAKAAKCGNCDGKGSIIADRHLGPGLVGKMKVTCPDCDGEGTRLRDKERCKKCKGVKVVKEKKKVEFMIDSGTEDGERIALSGEGDEAPDIPAGDVIFHIHHRSHPLFKPSPMNPSNLNITLRIRLVEALTGFDRVFFTHLDGRGIRLVSKRGERVIEFGQELLVKGEGLPRRGAGGRKGDLVVKFEVEMPGVGWASRLSTDGTIVDLPPPLKDIEPVPEKVETRYLSPK